MNKKNAALSLLLSFFLASCADTSELYPGNAYVSPHFLENHYSHWDEGLKEARIASRKTLRNVNEDGSTRGCYFAGSDLSGNAMAMAN